MTTTLNHTIVPAHDRWASARWLAMMLDLDEPQAYGPFVGVQVGPTTLDYVQVGADEKIDSVHFAFLVDEDQFDRTFARIQAAGDYFADPGGHQRGEINHHDGGRGVYFPDPSGHWMEILTVPYGGWPEGSPAEGGAGRR